MAGVATCRETEAQQESLERVLWAGAEKWRAREGKERRKDGERRGQDVGPQG